MPEVRPAQALLVDFGGVLTTSVFDSFRAYAGGAGPDPNLIEKLFREDKVAQDALVAHETGKQSIEAFEEVFAGQLRANGVDAEATGLVAAMTANLHPDMPMIGAVKRAGENGIPTVLVSNSLGYEAYEGYDLEELLDHVILSGHVGVRKPSRRIYEMGAEAAGIEPEDCVMIDDLAQNVSGAGRLGMQGIVHADAALTLPVLEQMFEVDFIDLLEDPGVEGVSAQIESGGKPR
ncbi:MAG: HAD family phosphatase [Solirubrobacterales bacterium]